MLVNKMAGDHNLLSKSMVNTPKSVTPMSGRFYTMQMCFDAYRPMEIQFFSQFNPHFTPNKTQVETMIEELVWVAQQPDITQTQRQ